MFRIRFRKNLKGLEGKIKHCALLHDDIFVINRFSYLRVKRTPDGSAIFSNHRIILSSDSLLYLDRHHLLSKLQK